MTGQTQTRDGDRPDDSDRRWHPVATRTIASSDEPVEATVLSAISDAKGVDPAELSADRLSDDVDALDESFFELGPGDVPGEVAGVVEFRYGKYRVTVSTDGSVDVAAPASSRGTVE